MDNYYFSKGFINFQDESFLILLKIRQQKWCCIKHFNKKSFRLKPIFSNKIHTISGNKLLMK